MSTGRFWTLDEFGWNASLSDGVQWAKTQDALNSGERLLMPVCETVRIDAPLVMRAKRGNLTGGGGDLTNNANAVSQIRTSVANMPLLRVEADHCHIAGLNLHADAAGCTGLVLGDGVTDHVRGVVVERLTTNSVMNFGVHVLSAGGLVLRDSWLSGWDAALRLENRLHSDTGDNKITNVDFNAYGPMGAGIRWTSGGGLYVMASKFVNGLNHISMDWNRGGSGNFSLLGSSLESNRGISLDMRGDYDFKRVQITGNTWGGIPSVAIVARSNCPSNWLKDLIVTGNTLDCYGVDPIMDLGCTDNAFITSNTLRGNGTVPYGIYTRNGTGGIGPNRFSGCGTAVQNSAGWAMTGQL